MNLLKSCRLKAAKKAEGEVAKRRHHRDRRRAYPAPDANAEFQHNIDVCYMITKSLSTQGHKVSNFS